MFQRLLDRVRNRTSNVSHRRLSVVSGPSTRLSKEATNPLLLTLISILEIPHIGAILLEFLPGQGLASSLVVCNQRTSSLVFTLATRLRLRRDTPSKVIASLLLKCTNLRVLSLRARNLATVPGEIRSLAGLQQLNVSCNEALENLPPWLGVELDQLETLNAACCRLNSLPRSIRCMRSLKTLSLSWNTQLNQLPSWMGVGMEQLCKLDLSGCAIEVLPESFGEMKSLRSLDLSVTRLTTLPEWFGEAFKNCLQFLSIGGALELLPAQFGSLNALQYLNLGSNTNLGSVPRWFGPAFANTLRKLTLTKCRLDTLPASFEQLAKLETLFLSDNFIYTIPDSLSSGLGSLKQLYLNRCALRSLNSFLGKISQFQTLSLQGNTRLKRLPSWIGQELTQLRELRVDNCGLVVIPNSLCTLQHLTHLSLAENSIRELPANFGPRLKALSKLTLRQNKIATLNTGLLKLPNDVEIDLLSNPLTPELGSNLTLKDIAAWLRIAPANSVTDNNNHVVS